MSELRLWSEGSQRNVGRKISQKSEGKLRSGQRLGSEESLWTKESLVLRAPVEEWEHVQLREASGRGKAGEP